jgi:hypothetical protein
MPADPIEYRNLPAAQRSDEPEPLLLFLAAFFFWLTHLLCQASVGYFYFAHRSGRTGRYLDDFLSSMLVDAGVSFAAAVTFFAVPFLVRRAGWMRLRSRPVSLGATCGAAFSVSRWAIAYYCTAKGYPYEQSLAEYLVADFAAAFLSVALLKKPEASRISAGR